MLWTDIDYANITSLFVFSYTNIQKHSNEKLVVKRVGMLIKLRPEHVEAYLKLHADDHPGVRDLLQKYNLRNFNIFIQKIDNQWFEFRGTVFQKIEKRRTRVLCLEKQSKRRYTILASALVNPL